VIGEDVHNLGITILEHPSNMKFKVVSLGIRVAPDDFINAAIETKADGIMISSSVGTPKFLWRDSGKNVLRQAFRTFSFISAGHLYIGEKNWDDMEKRYSRIKF